MQITLKAIKQFRISTGQFVLVFTLLNLVQAAFTGLHNDESYYWVYTHQLAWSYYDHPPMVALCMLIGKDMIAGELGLRLGSIIFVSMSLWVFLRMYPKDWLDNGAPFFILLSIPFFNYLSFTVWPDAPLIGFSVLFFYGYRSFLSHSNWKAILIMAFGLAGMLYSKYHGILIVPLLVISNWSLLKKWQLYAVFALALLLFTPHLVWQYQHGFPSFLYHLTGRSTPFDWKFPLRFLVEQLAVVGPLVIISLLYKGKGYFERFLKITVIGVYAFVFFLSVRGVVHMQWTSLTYLPIAFLCAGYYAQSNHKQLVLALCMPFFLLTLLLRLYLATSLFPGEKLGPNYVHGQEEWSNEIAEVSENRAMVFQNDLKIPSVYSYYSGNTAIAIYPGYRKKSQYELWHMEDSLQMLPVIIAQKDSFPGSQKLLTSHGPRIHFRLVDKFQSYQNIKVNVLEVEKYERSYQLKLEVINHRKQQLMLNADQVRFKLIGIANNEKERSFQPPFKELTIPPSSSVQLSFITNYFELSSKDQFVIGINDGILGTSHNSQPFDLQN